MTYILCSNVPTHFLRDCFPGSTYISIFFRIHPCMPECLHAFAHVLLSSIHNGIGWSLRGTLVDIQSQVGRQDAVPYPATNLSKARTPKLRTPQQLNQEEHTLRICSLRQTHCESQQSCSQCLPYIEEHCINAENIHPVCVLYCTLLMLSQ